MTELVLAIHRNQLSTKDLGIIPFSFDDMNPQAYAWLPRDIVDSKTDHANTADIVGIQFPQILGYFQIMNDAGKILAYQRKGKEKGLFGQWSIGIGGHVSNEDLEEIICNGGTASVNASYPDLAELVYEGAYRELNEEIGITPCDFSVLKNVKAFKAAATKCIQSFDNATSSRHIGLPLLLKLQEAGIEPEELELDPAEFCNYKWMSIEELKANWNQFEDWSKWLINSY